MNWKTLLVVAGLSLSIGLTACNKEAAAPDATKVDTTTTTTSPAVTTETKPADGAKTETKTTETKTTETKPADGAMKSPDAMKSPETTKSTTTKTTETKPATTKPQSSLRSIRKESMRLCLHYANDSKQSDSHQYYF